MTDDNTDSDTVPGSGAGDAAHSTRIPRIERSSNGTTTTKKSTSSKSNQKSTGAKSSPSKSSASKSGATTSSTKSPSSSRGGSSTRPQTDKGRPRKTGSAGSSNRPLTAADYGGASTTTATIDDTARDTTDATGTTDTASAPSKDASETTTTTTADRDPVRPVTESTTATSTAAAATPAPAVGGEGGTATLRLSFIEPWSVTRMAFAVSVAMMIVAVVATAIFWLVLQVTGVWGAVDNSVSAVLSDQEDAFSITDYLGFGRLVGLTLLLSAINVIVMTFLATVAAHLYNLAAQVLGGFQVTYTNDHS